MEAANPIQRIVDDLFGKQHGQWPLMLVYGGTAVLLLILVYFTFSLLRRGRARGPAQEENVLTVHLAQLPPPPPGAERVAVEGVSGRLRLVAIAPVGKANLDTSNVSHLLDQFLRGLGAVAAQDKPKIVVWPPQLSNQAFGVVFHRHVKRPEPDGQPSRWILVAGQTPARPRPLLVGLVVESASPCAVGRLTLKPEQWTEVVRVQS